MNISQTITREQSRQADRRAVEEYGMSGLVLMENAGRGTADVLCDLLEVAGGNRDSPRAQRETVPCFRPWGPWPSAVAKGTMPATDSS